MPRSVVSDLMTWSPICVHTDDTLAMAWKWMSEERIRHLPVVDEDGALVGLLSHRDLALRALAGLEDLPVDTVERYLERLPVSDAMVAEPQTAEPNDDLAEAAQTMLDHKFGCLPIVEGGQVVGILTEADFVRSVVQQQAN